MPVPDDDWHLVVPAMVYLWQMIRAEIKEAEQAEHPPITDHFGRVWTWRDGDGDDALYVHCRLAKFEAWILDPGAQLPPDSLLDNPNYKPCEICRAGRPAETVVVAGELL